MTDNITLPREVAKRILRNIEIGNKLSAGIEMRREIEAALEQPQDHHEQHLNMVPEGWKLVPVEPTLEMLRSGVQRELVDASHYGRLGDTYRAMLAAAPELLEALRKLHHALDECDMVHDDQRSAYANASAIIAKATGETK